MTCPNCSSAAAIGNDVASVCTDCASVSVAGGSLNLPVILFTVVAAASAVLLAGSLRQFFGRQPQLVASAA